ncbi:hypothetical protein D3C76_1716840 [compost metagenome]
MTCRLIHASCRFHNVTSRLSLASGCGIHRIRTNDCCELLGGNAAWPQHGDSAVRLHLDHRRFKPYPGGSSIEDSPNEAVQVLHHMRSECRTWTA